MVRYEDKAKPPVNFQQSGPAATAHNYPIMLTQEWLHTWHDAPFDVRLVRAHYVLHAYPRHSHDYYVICLTERGLQSFTHEGAKHLTPPGGVILINPGTTHKGEAADEQGFQMRCNYPTVAHMQAAVFELTGRHWELPFFVDVRVDDRWAGIAY